MLVIRFVPGDPQAICKDAIDDLPHVSVSRVIVAALAPSTYQRSETWPDLANLVVNSLYPPGASVRSLQEWLSLSLNLYGIAEICLQAFSAPHWLVEHHLFPCYISAHTAEAPNP